MSDFSAVIARFGTACPRRRSSGLPTLHRLRGPMPVIPPDQIDIGAAPSWHAEAQPRRPDHDERLATPIDSTASRLGLIGHSSGSVGAVQLDLSHAEPSWPFGAPTISRAGRRASPSWRACSRGQSTASARPAASMVARSVPRAHGVAAPGAARMGPVTLANEVNGRVAAPLTTDPAVASSPSTQLVISKSQTSSTDSTRRES